MEMPKDYVFITTSYATPSAITENFDMSLTNQVGEPNDLTWIIGNVADLKAFTRDRIIIGTTT